MNRVMAAAAVAVAGLSFLVPEVLPAGAGWEAVRSAKAWLGLAEPQAPAGARGWGQGYVPNVTVVNQDGEKLSFFDDLIKDKVVVVSFIYTTCKDVCPLTTARMAQVQHRLGDAVGRDFFFVSITIDPEHDTPEVLKQYASAYDPGPGWDFVTGDKDDIELLRDRLGDRLEDLSDHTQEVRIGNGATGQWRRAALLGDMETLVESIRQMDPRFRERRRDFASTLSYEKRYRISDEHPGQAVFRRLCSPCHTVGDGDRVGPDLYGILDRRDRDWLVQYMMHPARMRAAKDPTALAVSAQWPNVDMPTLGLGEIDAEDMLAYFAEETARLKTMEAEAHASQDHSSNDHSAHDHGEGRQH